MAVGNRTILKKRHVAAKSSNSSKEITEDNENEEEPQKPKTYKDYFKTAIKCILLILVMPPFLNYVALIKEDREFKRAGDLNETFIGQKLFVQCKGKGKPTVILDSPSGLNSDVWNHIFDEVAEQTRVCVYDRAGIGFSERPKVINSTAKHGTFHTTERMVDDLRFLFSNKTQHEKPFLFVGAELGANNARFYAQMYQDDVTSLILINPLFEGLFVIEQGQWEKFWLGPFIGAWQHLHLLAIFGITRIGLHLGALKGIINGENLPEILESRQKHLMCKPSHLFSAVEEHYFLNESLAQIRLLNKLRPLSNTIPVTVLASSKFSNSVSDSVNKIWRQSQSLYKKSLHQNLKELRTDTTADKVLLNKQDYAVIVNTIKQDVTKWRTESRKVSKF
eukprot:Seg1737.4 transcript_id=Seg1737.4/GoldUCD/mRNA.D3Y31 product="hypothetical protein" protein_id=Seg1737.4/GoldUCD/D3Y31